VMSLPCLRRAFEIAASHTGVCAAIDAAFSWGAKVHFCIVHSEACQWSPSQRQSPRPVGRDLRAERALWGSVPEEMCDALTASRSSTRHPGDRRGCARPIRDLPARSTRCRSRIILACGPDSGLTGGNFREPYSPGNLAAIKRFSRLPRRLAGGICISGLPAVCWCSKQPVPPGNGGHLRLWRSWMTGDQGFVSGVRARRRPLRPQTVQLRLR
jgi:hypothetical protein